MNGITIERVGIRYGIFTAIALIAFFFLMKLIGLVQVYELRALNAIFLFTGVYLAIRYYKKHSPSIAYLNGLGVGLLTSAIALLFFSIFVVIYLGAIDPAFMESLKQNEIFGQYLNPYIAGAAIFLEGTLSGLLVSFILMQYYKQSHMNKADNSMP
jgi:hypothetical protein